MTPTWVERCKELGAPFHHSDLLGNEDEALWRGYFLSQSAILDTKLGRPVQGSEIAVDLDFEAHHGFNDEQLAAIILAFPNTRRLVLKGCSKASDQTAKAVKSLKDLRSLNVVSCPELHPNAILSELQNLEALHISHCTIDLPFWTDIQRQPLRALQLISTHWQIPHDAALHLPALRSLKLTEFWGMRPKHLTSLFEQVPQLNKLALRQANDLSFFTPNLLPKTLDSLEIAWCDRFDDRGLAKLEFALPDLRSLKLARCSLLTDRAFEPIQSLPNLRKLELSHAPLVTSNGWGQCLSHCSELNELRLSGCALSDNGAAQLARQVSLKELEVPSHFQIDWLLNCSLPELNSFAVSDNPHFDEDALLPAISKWNESQLKRLDIMGCCISSATIDALLQLENLRELHLGGRVGRALNITAEQLARICSLAHLEKFNCALISSLDREMLEVLAHSRYPFDLEVGPNPKLRAEDLEALAAHSPLRRIWGYGISELPPILKDLFFGGDDQQSPESKSP